MWWGADLPTFINTLRPRQNGRHFADDIFKCIFLDENVSIAVKISPKFVPKDPINNIPALVQIMACRLDGQPMMVSLPMHICVARPQWVKDGLFNGSDVIQITWNNSYDTIITIESAWWLLMPWHLFNIRAYAIIMVTQAGPQISGMSQHNTPLPWSIAQSWQRDHQLTGPTT